MLLLLFRTLRITLCDRRNRNDRVSRARCPPGAVEDDTVERLPVLAAEERAVQALRTRNRAEELAVGRENVYRLARRHVHSSLLIDRGSVATLPALQLSELALISQRAVRVHVEGLDNLSGAHPAVYAANHLSAIDIPGGDTVRELILAHRRPDLHEIYDQYAYFQEKKFTLEAWARRLKSIVEPPIPAENVVRLSAA